MKRILLPMALVGTLVSLSCTKPAPNPIPTPLPTATPNTPSLSNITPTPIETPEPRQYVIEDLKGSALIFEEGSTQGEKAEEEEVVESGDEIITKTNSDMTLTLDENTLVHIPANSDVKVDQLMPNSSKGFVSRLKLVEGKVLCEVERLQETQSSFEVSAGGVICGVRGTAFEVQKQGQLVHTNTFHGVVEMKKGDHIKQVSANQHLAFSLKQGAFAPLRPLKSDEKGHYKTWVRKQDVVRQKQSRRMAVLHSIANLPPEDQAQLFRNVSKVKPKDRVKKMRQLLQKTYVPEPKAPVKREDPRHNQGKLQRQHPKENRHANRAPTEARKNLKSGENSYPNKQKGQASRPVARTLPKKPSSQGRPQALSPAHLPKAGQAKPQRSQPKPKTQPSLKPPSAKVGQGNKTNLAKPKNPVEKKTKISKPKKQQKPSEK